jgi:hypothetical protein
MSLTVIANREQYRRRCFAQSIIAGLALLAVKRSFEISKVNHRQKDKRRPVDFRRNFSAATEGLIQTVVMTADFSSIPEPNDGKGE